MTAALQQDVALDDDDVPTEEKNGRMCIVTRESGDLTT